MNAQRPAQHPVTSPSARRIAFVSTYAAEDPRSWSGIPSRMVEGLRAAGLDVTPIGPLHRRCDLLWRVNGRARRAMRAPILLPDREPWVARGFARQLESLLDDVCPDAVVSPGTLPVALLRDDVPVISWTDATFAAVRGYYPGFSDLALRTVTHAESLERSGLQRCAAAVYASAWAVSSAVEHYGLPRERVHEVPFGANLDPAYTEDEVMRLISRRPADRCELLFVGVDWQRKGADLAMRACTLLRQRGIDARLTIVGCRPPSTVAVPRYVRLAGFVPRGADARDGPLGRLFAAAHFFILPTRAEAFGIVLAEASAFGVPSLATRTGGVTSVVRDGCNGRLFDLTADADEYCEAVVAMMSDRQTYSRAAVEAHREYARRLTWGGSCHAVANIIDRVCREASC